MLQTSPFFLGTDNHPGTRPGIALVSAQGQTTTTGCHVADHRGIHRQHLPRTNSHRAGIRPSCASIQIGVVRLDLGVPSRGPGGPPGLRVSPVLYTRHRRTRKTYSIRTPRVSASLAVVTIPLPYAPGWHLTNSGIMSAGQRRFSGSVPAAGRPSNSGKPCGEKCICILL